MEVKSLYKYARVSPLKARDVAREIQGLPVSAALDVLNFTPRKAAFLIGKTLKSATANAENNHELDIESLVVKEATATDGPSFRRFKARARGSGAPIKRRTSHLQIILSDEIESETREEKRKKKSKPKGKKQAAKKGDEKSHVLPFEKENEEDNFLRIPKQKRKNKKKNGKKVAEEDEYEMIQKSKEEDEPVSRAL